MNNLKWSFYKIWNESLEEGKDNKILEPRERMWATELGGAYVDRYLKMKAVTPSNPPNARSRRKFEAGNIWEYIIKYVLNRAGILISHQNWVMYQYEGLLPVTGKLDFLAGGHPDYDKASSIIQKEFNFLPPFISKATMRIVARLKEEYPNGLDEIVLEIKSCSSFMFELYEKYQTGNPNHKLQLFHYLKSLSKDEGHIVYISKDDARLLEIGVTNPSYVEAKYKMDIEKMTNYIKADTQPELEKPIIFDEEFRKFSANYRIGYSQYLTYLYGFKNQKEFDDKYKPITEKWNRVLKRVMEEKTMTENNQEALGEMEKEGFDVKKIIENIREKDGAN